jgi:FtsZ-binding cell division protein ZapB
MEENHECLKKEKFAGLEKDIRKNYRAIEFMQEEIKELQRNGAETRVYVKQIFERIDDIKELFKATNHETNQTWQPVMLELIKMMGIVAAVIAGIKIVG